MPPVRNSHIIRHTLRNYLAAAIFAGIIIQLNCTIDSMVAGQFIGADAVSVIVLALPLVNILMLPGTILLMGTTLLIAPAFGNQDYGRVNRMLTVGLALCASALLLAFPAGVASLFGADATLAPLSAGPLRIFSGVFLPAMVLMTQANAFLLVKRGRLAGLLQAGIVICTLPLALALSRWNLWVALPLGMLLPMLGGLAASLIFSRRAGDLHPVWLIPGSDARHAFAVSVGYSRESVLQQFSLLCERLEAMHLPQAENTAVTHCVEEMMLHQLEMGQSCGLRGSFDVGIVDGDDHFTILVKAAGKAFNPLYAYQEDTPASLSLRIVEGYCRDVNYRYASGVNCVYLNFDKEP